MLQTGLSATVRLVVGEDDTALAAGSGDLAVLATPRLVALCEEATLAAVAGALEEGQTTVGTRVEIDHLRAVPVGATVEASAVLGVVDGHLLRFSVRATSGGRRLAEGAVHRAVVDRRRFLDRL